MKKILSILLLTCLLLSFCLTLASCGHECEFSTDWSKDATHHWHVCTGEECTEIADKAEHTWDNGVITTVPAQAADGIKTYTCTACTQTKTETVAFTGMSEDEWNAAFVDDNFIRFTYHEVATVASTGFTINTETLYKLTANLIYGKMTIAGESEEDYTADATEITATRTALVDSIKEMTAYESFTYDRQTKTYKATEAIFIKALNSSTDDITLTFSDGKVTKIEYTISFISESVNYTATSVVTLSEYGTAQAMPTA